MSIEQRIIEIRQIKIEISFLKELLFYVDSKEELEQLINTRLENLENYLEGL